MEGGSGNGSGDRALSGGHSSAWVALVTGGNRGIGLEICKQLASSGVMVVLTARDKRRGIEAVSALGSLGLSNVVFHQLEVSDPSSTARSADFIKDMFGKLDILVNNAGIVGTTTQIGDPETFWHEFFSGEELKKELNNIDNLSEKRLDELSELFLKDFKDGQLKPRGWPTDGGVAVVTGGNRGIGLEICKQLASSGVTVVLTARDVKKGAEAVSVLGTLGLSNIVFHQLDVGDPSSAAHLADFIKEKFGKLDILVNNAGISGTTSEVGNAETFRQEFFSGEELKQELNNINNLSEQRLDELSELFLKDFKDSQLARRGWPTEGGVAVVTGGNRGIGLEVCKQLASNGITVVLTARDQKRGAEAVSILGELGLSNIVFHQLDVSDPSSAVNNAAISGTISDIGNPETFRQEFFSGDELKQELNNIDNLSEHRLDELSELFLKDFKDGQLEGRGWPTEGGFIAYKVSKAIMNAYSRILAKEYPSLCINCVHPGFVQTDMSFQVGDLSVKEGARGALMMALAPKGGMTGGLLNRTEPAPFV
nr:unnamed protein product [Digitaria exilis]